MQVSGTGFDPNARVDLEIDGLLIQAINADNSGIVRATVQIPVVAGGTKIISVSGATSSSAQASFEVTPTFDIDQLTASVGALVNVSGTGFRANEPGISVSFDSTRVAPGITADNQGRWSGSFTVPTSTAGNHRVTAKGSLTTANIPTRQLSIGAGVSLARTNGKPGDVVTISGSGVRANEQITINVGNGLATFEATADRKGVWTTDITIPAAPRGLLIIRATGAVSQATTTSFNVAPKVDISEPTGAPGTAISLEGQGFEANQSSIPISFDGDIVTSASANAQGSWTATLTIPPSPKGTYFIKISGTSPELQSAFTVTPALSLNRPQAGPGESATVSGSGFAANETGIALQLGETNVATGISSNADGSWTHTFAVPALPADSYTLTARGTRPLRGVLRAGY